MARERDAMFTAAWQLEGLLAIALEKLASMHGTTPEGKFMIEGTKIGLEGALSAIEGFREERLRCLMRENIQRSRERGGRDNGK